MKSYEKLTPEGTRDFLFEESDALRRIERGLSELFKEKGYKKVITPTVEFFDVFNRESAGTLPENLYSMTDAYGRLLVLRPDSTLPIARIAATRLKGAELPIRLYYNQNVFSRRKKLTGRNDETSQSGIELIGVNGIRALNSVLDTLGGDRVAETIRNLPRMFGGSEVIEKAMTLCKSDKAQNSLNYLDKLYKKLGGANGGDNLIIDLSLVHRSNYYTGIVFRGYTEGSGATVLQGGRYDGLIKEFGEDLPAIGFGVQTDDLARAALMRGEIEPQKASEVLVFGEDGYELAAVNLVRELSQKGVKSENSLCESRDEALKYAKERGIKKLFVISRDGVSEEEL